MSFLANGCSIVFYLLLARSVSPIAYGDVMAGITTAFVVGGLLNFGSNTHLVRELSAGRMLWSDVAPPAVGRVVYSVAASALLGTFFWLFPASASFTAGLGVSMLTFSAHLSQFAQVIPLSGQRITFSGITLVVEKLVPLVILAVWLSVSVFPFWLAPILMAIGCLAAALLNLLLLAFVTLKDATPRRALPLRFSRLLVAVPVRSGSVLNPWKGSYGIGFASVFYSLRQLDVLVARFGAGAAVAGEYAAVARWVQPISMVASSIGNMTLPRIASASSIAEALRIMLRFTPLVLVLCGASVVCAMYAEDAVTLVLGAQYSGASMALTVLALSMPILFVRQLVYIVLIGRGIDLHSARMVVAVSVLGLISVIPLASIYGAAGASFAYLVSELVMLIGFAFLAGWEIRKEAAG